MRCARALFVAVAIAAANMATLASAQAVSSGRTAESSVGRVGQRQTRGDSTVSNAPMQRLSTRIASRIDARIRNRIDRTYVREETADAYERAEAAAAKPVNTIPQ